MPALYLIRHGQASFGADDYDQLSPLGERQSSHLGQAFATMGLQAQHVICGDMKRHRQTAEHCLAALGEGGRDWQTDADWNEYEHDSLLNAYTAQPGMGEQMMADMAGENARAGFQQHFTLMMARWVGGQHNEDYEETWPQFCARIARALKTASRSSKGNIFIFTSAGVISAVCKEVLGVSDSAAVDLSWQLANAGYSKISSGQTGLKLLSLNEHSHFDGQHRDLISYR